MYALNVLFIDSLKVRTYKHVKYNNHETEESKVIYTIKPCQVCPSPSYYVIVENPLLGNTKAMSHKM